MDNNDNKNTDDTVDFGMEDDSSEEQPQQPEQKPEQKPVVNKYTDQKDEKQTPDTSSQAQVDPNAAAPTPPPAPKAQQPAPETGQNQEPRPPQQAPHQPSQPNQPNYQPQPAAQPSVTVKTAPKSAGISPRAVYGFLGGFGALALIFLVLSFVFLGQTADGINPIAQLLNVQTAPFVNGLITFIHLVFLVIALTAFVFTMIGLFQASMAKKGDKVARRKGFKQSMIAGIIFLIVLIIWMFVYVYLDSKRIQTAPRLLDPIVTEPEETIGLTAPIEIKFDASNVPVESGYQIISYNWNFGDGSTGTNVITSHIYEEKGDGEFDVTLLVRKRDKKTAEILEDEYPRIVTIANEALNATFTADPQSGEAPLEVQFDAGDSTDPDGTIDRYEWDFDEDGEFDDAEGIQVSHEFTKLGVYTVALRVTNTIGEYNIEEKEIVVEEAVLPEAVITITDEPETFTVGTQYIFSAKDSTSPNGTIESYSWDFGDGSEPVTTKTASHTYDRAGNYEVTLTVVDEDEEEGETILPIEVESKREAPVAQISTEPALEEGALSLEGEVPFEIVFDASKTTDRDNNIVDYQWDFDGNGVFDGVGEKVTYSFTEPGTYSVKLLVTDSDDNTGEDTVIVKVKQQGITAALEADKIDGSVPLTVEFDASGSTYPSGSITSYQWNFGDGTSPKIGSAKITHKYTEIGTYTASVTVTGSDNTRNTTEITITVREIPLTACFVTVFEEGPAPLETSFDPACSSGTIQSYFWDFGDGSTSTKVKPVHVFEDPDTYTVTLEVADTDNNISKAELEIEVTD